MHRCARRSNNYKRISRDDNRQCVKSLLDHEAEVDTTTGTMVVMVAADEEEEEEAVEEGLEEEVVAGGDEYLSRRYWTNYKRRNSVRA
jgi:hypothetical protein